ncbi:MAG TPA: SH3 domain-containing C40 family peptidase [Longimicrobiaceae bacterium]|nr:SH3 domain-containing C40 family peptidase [Longimicrobiaceae bacterium]
MVRDAAAELRELVEAVRGEYAPDPRLAVFDVAIEERGRALVIAGATSEAAAAEALHHRVAALTGWVEVIDEVVRLPDGAADERMHGLVNAAVAPMLSGPDIRATQVSQAVLGSRLVVYRSRGRWLQCRAPDGYLGWIHAGYLALTDESGARAWETGVGGEPWLSLGAEVRTPDDEVLVRLPWGARVVREGADAVRLPDGRKGRPVGELLPAALRHLAFPPTGEAVAATAVRWLGVPYLWGGVTLGGVDCSGFVQALYRMHGRALPRDSDQQSRAGEPVACGDDFCDLRAGDLLFFAEEPGRCSHVAMSAGGSRIIHASLGNGGVAWNDLAGRRSYERELRRLFLWARRVA